MSPCPLHKEWVAGIAFLFSLASAGIVQSQPQIGPATEKRFPPLTVPKGFQSTLFACDPLVKYPSVISLGPRPGTLFVAHDYLTGLGVDIVRRDEIRLLADTDGDGYADKSNVFAKGFNSIQGLAYSDGTIFAMHAPLLTALKDTDGDGVADERTDLVKGLGLPPEENSNRLHCANGVTVGHDGWLYLSLGDRGCDVQRKEGDRLVFREGGMMRCRPDGSDLHVFSGGLRNIYDIALDEELNAFTRDNENDGGDYMIRVCHSFHGADHGYPYLYDELPQEAMTPLADLGRGSSAGGVCYRETSFPAEYYGDLFFCEWGRAVVRYPLQRAAGGFAPTKEIEFISGSPDDPYGFKPTDIVVDYDGSLLISDWCDGQRPKRGRGRIYRISYESTAPPPAAIQLSLDSANYHTRVGVQHDIEKRSDKAIAELKRWMLDGKFGYRGRLHGVWILAHCLGEKAVEDLFQLAETDADMRVRAQAVRAIADLTDPILVKHRLAAGRGSAEVAARLAKLGANADPRVTLEVVVALGRLRWAGSPNWLRQNLKSSDLATLHAAQQTLRRADNWAEVLELLDLASVDGKSPVIREVALRALANQANETLVDGLTGRLASEPLEDRRREYVEALARVYKEPAAWVYWGFRPAPRPANSVAWSRTDAVEKAMHAALADRDLEVRRVALQQMLREEIPVPTASLARWLTDENNADRVAVILDALKDRLPPETPALLAGVIRDKSRDDRNRLTALTIFITILEPEQEKRLLALARETPDGPVMAKLLSELGGRPQIHCNSLLLAKLESGNAEVRAAAISSLSRRGCDAAVAHLVPLLSESNLTVLRAATAAAGDFGVAATSRRLLELATHEDPAVRRAALKSLRQVRYENAISAAVAGLKHPLTQLSALEYLEQFGGPTQTEAIVAVAGSSHSRHNVVAAASTLVSWSSKLDEGSSDLAEINDAIAKVQGAAGELLCWDIRAPIPAADVDRTVKNIFTGNDSLRDWKKHFVTNDDSVLRFPTTKKTITDPVYLASCKVFSKQESQVEFTATGSGDLQMWLNGKSVFRRDKPTSSLANSNQVEGTLSRGVNRLLVAASAAKSVEFSLRFRQKSSQADQERLTSLALQGRGNPARGRELFLNTEKTQCVNCHRIGSEGGRIGPDLASIGRRFSRIHIIEAILQPSRSLAPSYQTVSLVLTDGRVLAGVKQHETETMLRIGDNQGKIHEIKKGDIEASRDQPSSTMPEGLEKKLSDREFVDLIAFLLSQKE